MFDNYTRGLIQNLDYVTKFSTVVSEMMKRSIDVLCTSSNGFVIDSDYMKDELCITDNSASMVFCKVVDKFEYLIKIDASINDEEQIPSKGFIGTITLTLHETAFDDEDYPIDESEKTIQTPITITPGSPVYVGGKKTSIYGQLRGGHRSRPGEISVGNFDRKIPCIENDIDMDNEDYFVLHAPWDRKMLREWFDQMMHSLDVIYETSFEEVPPTEYSTDMLEDYK